MQIFLTGGTGFVGRHILRELAARGHTISALVRNRKKARRLEEYIDRIVIGDLADRRALEEGVAGAEAVVHAASIMSAKRPRDFWRVNVDGARNVLQAANRVAGGLERFVLVSSISAAGPSAPGERLRENEVPRPVSQYGESKLAAEELAWKYTDRFGVTVVRPPIVYGPGDKQTLMFFRMVQQGRVWSVFEPRMQVSLVYVSDLADGVASALESEAGVNQTFYFADDARPTVTELIETMEETLSARASMQQVPHRLAAAAAFVLEGWGFVSGRPGLITRDKLRDLWASGWACGTANARERLGWRPKVDYRDGIRQAAEWYYDHGWLAPS